MKPIRTRREKGSGPHLKLSVSAAQDWRARWDRQQELGIPDREARFGAMLEALGAAAGRRFHVLDIGCGTGSLSERILRQYPDARSVALDHDPVLLKIGRTGLGDFGGRLTWVDVDLRRRDWTMQLPVRRFDAAVSTTALHWLTGVQLSRLYRELAGLLRTGGWLLNGDQIEYSANSTEFRRLSRGLRPPVPSARRPPVETWEQWWRSVLSDPRFALEAELHRLRYPHAHTETPTPDIDGHIRRLKAAGFREAELVWSHWDNRILAALR